MFAQALHNEIKGKQEKVEDIQKDAETCATSIKVSINIHTSCTLHIYLYMFQLFVMMLPTVLVCNYIYISLAVSLQDYELHLASYSAGLETLLNIPIKRTVLKSPATVVRQEVGAPLIQRQFTVTHHQGGY